MNDIFSPSRFSNYVCLYAGENKKKLLQILLVIVGILIFGAAIYPILKGVYSQPTNNDPMWDRETGMFWSFLFLSICIFSAYAFNSCDSKLKRISALSFPVSSLEKYLTFLLFYCIAVYIVFICGLVIADYLRVWTAPIYAAPGSIIAPMPLSYFFTFGYENGENIEKTMVEMMIAYSALISLQSFFFLAASIWPKSTFRKGFLSLIGISIGFNAILFLSMRCVKMIYGHILIFRFKDWFENLGTLISLDTFLIFGYIISSVLTLGMYILAYYRFKEMESIERW